MTLKQRFRNTPSLRISFRYCTIAVILLILVSLTLPRILNYGPEFINSAFDVQMSYISYAQQFIIISIVVLFTLWAITKFLLRDIDKWYALNDAYKYQDANLIKKIRKKCFNLPYIIAFCEIIVPLILTIIFLFITGSHDVIMIIKICLLITCFLIILSICSNLFAKDLYSEILEKTYSKDLNIGFRISLRKKIFLQLLPLFIAGVLITSLVGYSRAVNEKEDIYFSVYNRYLHSVFNEETTYTYDEIKNLFADIELFDNENHSKFVIFPDGTIDTLTGPEASNFVKEYTLQLSDKYNGQTFDSYGLDTQGATMSLNTIDGTMYVGILYDIASWSSLAYLLVNMLILLVLLGFVLYLFGKSLSKDLKIITDGLNKIYLNESGNTKDLPVISNDEMGDLVIAFNKIQRQQQEYLQTIRNNQEMLMEKERLASLGQLIGGIAHNLKTPIMSISGAAEGLEDLIREYNESIEDSQVTVEDHHAIAKDMQTWIEKIRSYTEYMSDVITAVKGQAVNMSDEQNYSFTVDELVKRIDILMKHELKSALVSLNLIMEVDPLTTLDGNINSLVQVINNMISNSIQAYKGTPNKSIDLIIKEIDNNIIISIRDYASGLSKEVQDKLFKEMVTTKGKNGTGLGLFMSYSTIRAHFNGNITFDTKENEGTTFNITLPKPEK